jgi:hypothetical protein
MIYYIYNNPNKYIFSIVKTFCPIFFETYKNLGTIISINNGIFYDDNIVDENYGFEFIEWSSNINKKTIFISKIIMDIFPNDKEKYLYCIKKLKNISKFYFVDILEQVHWIYFFEHLISIHPDTIYNNDLIYWAYGKRYNDLLKIFFEKHNIIFDKKIEYWIKNKKYQLPLKN